MEYTCLSLLLSSSQSRGIKAPYCRRLRQSVSVSKQTRCLTSTETIRLIRDGEKVGDGGVEVGGGIIYLSLHCHHQKDSCIKMGSDESHFNVS